MIVDNILKLGQIFSLVGFMINSLFIIVGNDLLKFVLFGVFSLYLFLGITWVNHSRKNGVNDEKVIKEVSIVVLGTVILIITITLLFKIIEWFSVV